MMFKQGTKLFAYEVEREAGQNVMYVNFLGASFVPSIADSPDVMSRVIDYLIESPDVSRVVFVQQRNYSYGFNEVEMLLEIAQMYTYLIKQERILSSEKLGLFGSNEIPGRYETIRHFLELLKSNPALCYKEVERDLKQERARLDVVAETKTYQRGYVGLLEKMYEMLKNTKLIRALGAEIEGNANREIYSNLFRAVVIPNFTFTRLMASLPSDANIVSQYTISSGYDESTVTILKREDDSKFIYHLMPPEYVLDEEHHMLLNLARNVLIEHRPKEEEYSDAERTRQVFFNISRDLLQELAETKKINLKYNELNKLANILVRYTIGFGLIEILLQDERIQDIVLNAPISQNKIFVRHSEFDECVTNIIPSQEDAESWAAKFRMISGRPLDEANPVLDTELNVGKARARVAIIQQPLSPYGIAYSFRRHRDSPWTLPLFIHNRMINSFSAGLFSFLVDGARTMLVAGTRSAGKSSFLGALMLEIMPKFRVICVEDSVTGNSSMIIKENGIFRKVRIGDLIDDKIKMGGYIDIDGREKVSNIGGIEIFSVDKLGKVVLAKPSKFIRHKNSKQIYEIVTSSGKRISVTEDHSLFALDEKEIIKPVRVSEIKKGDFLAVPSRLPFDSSLTKIDLFDFAPKLGKKIFVFGEGIKSYLETNAKTLRAIGKKLRYDNGTVQNWIRKKILPFKVYSLVRNEITDKNLFIKGYGNSKSLPCEIVLDDTLLSFFGLWIADGCYDKNSVIISVAEEENRSVVRKIAERFGISAKMHSDGFSLMLNSSLLKEVMQKIFELNGNSYTKKIPGWAYNLSDSQLGAFLNGIFSGDGCVSDKEILFSVRSKELVEDISTLMLRFGIVARGSGRISRGHYLKRDEMIFSCRIGATKMLKQFKENIGFLVKSKQERLDRLSSRLSSHDTSDIIPLSLEVKKELSKILGKRFNTYDYIARQNNLGREHLVKLLNLVPSHVANPIKFLKEIVKSDIFWDNVKEIKKVEYKGYVYDISVPGPENFICENMVAHNTLELPVDALRKIGYDILRMKVRSALLQSTTEVAAEEGIRTSLRLGDSCLIVGEVRSVEARALYEAMRIGALANVVAGTIHGASPYGVFDRVVNDLNVPVTSFKATDIIAVTNPVKSADGLHSWKRIVGLTEVRKHWTKDPMEERGFVDLLRYNVDKDELEATDELINGDSEVIKEIARNVKGWAGNWDSVYDNILLRGKIKNEIVEMAERLKIPQLLEAEFNAASNNAFYRISDIVRQEIGIPLGERVFGLWKEWAKKEVKRISEG